MFSFVLQMVTSTSVSRRISNNLWSVYRHELRSWNKIISIGITNFKWRIPGRVRTLLNITIKVAKEKEKRFFNESNHNLIDRTHRYLSLARFAPLEFGWTLTNCYPRASKCFQSNRSYFALKHHVRHPHWRLQLPNNLSPPRFVTSLPLTSDRMRY